MIRKIIKIDTEKCNGCGLCVEACHEGAICMAEGKAKLLRDDYCDGLGDCLPVCHAGAITFEKREALKYNEAEVKKNIDKKKIQILPCGCPGSNAKAFVRENLPQIEKYFENTAVISQLNQWPIQIKLAPTNASYFDEAKLLIAADCAAYAYANFHNDFIKDRVTLIGCPKLDGDYSDKLTEILYLNDIKSITVARMQVPCCRGIETAVMQALQNYGKMIKHRIVIISIDGNVIK